MPKRLKPGQLATINDAVYRAYKRECGCAGCDLNDIFLCPCIVDRRYREPKYNCALDNIIFKLVQ